MQALYILLASLATSLAICVKSPSETFCNNECYFSIKFTNEDQQSFDKFIQKPNWLRNCNVLNLQNKNMLIFYTWDTLEFISFSNCSIPLLNGSNLQAISNFKRLYIQDSNLSQFNISTLYHLEFINFSNNSIDVITNHQFENNNQLKHIDLSANNIYLIEPEAFEGNYKTIYMVILLLFNFYWVFITFRVKTCRVFGFVIE